MFILVPEMLRVSIGRQPGADVWIGHDRRVSRSHALLERMGATWVLVDGGLSRNGTWVNGEPLRNRRRLTDGDRIRVGNTSLAFSDPHGDGHEGDGSTDAGGMVSRIEMLTPQQRDVLSVLCAPLRGSRHAPAATNAEIAEALHISVDSVKGHLRILFQIFGLAELAQNRKRAELAAIGAGAGLAER